MATNSKNFDLIKGNDLLSGGGPSLALINKRQESEGLNELPSNKPKKYYSFLFDTLKEPMVYLLLGCGIIYFFLGDRQEAIMLLGFLFLIIGITIVQEAKAGKAIEALRQLSSPRALVLRNGKQTRISGREVVREEIIFLNEGDRIPADATIISSTNLNIDESLLTGESAPVIKSQDDKIFAGSTVVQGFGVALVYAIGRNTQMGIIGSSIRENLVAKTKLEEQTNELVKHLAWVAALLCALVVIFYSIKQHNWVEGILVGLSLAMAILPNELPAVLTIFFSLGAWRLSQRKVLTRKISAVENLGSITVLCVDKTGTLTLNQMAIQKIYSHDKVIDLTDTNMQSIPEEFHEALEFGILASRKDPLDPMELAFTSAGIKFLKGTEHLHYDWNLEKEYPLSAELLSISRAWKSNSHIGCVVGAKGAPEAIIDLCHMTEALANKTKMIAEEMASLGLRIIGVAKSHADTSQLPPKQHDFDFTFLGLIGISDPIRSGVPASIAECRSAGIRVIMLTGDHPVTASSIAKKIGLQNPDTVTSGAQMETLTDLELTHLAKNISVFSRVSPTQKLRLVESLKNAGEIVAMTGDGVNDAPALKSAHIGIAMGARGTDVARESSDMVLLDDDFSSIVEAIRTGRRVYSNIKNALVYLFAIHIPIAGMSVLPAILGFPLVLMPAHIAFIHLIIEPASSVAFEVEPASPDIMFNRPRSANEPLFNNDFWISSLLKGFIFLMALSSVYLFSIWKNKTEEEIRTLVFTTLIFSNTLLIFLSRGLKVSLWSKLASKPNYAVKWLIIISIAMLGFVLYSQTLREILRFSYLSPLNIFICLLVGIMNILAGELLVEILQKRKTNKVP